MARAIFNGQVIAESDDIVEVESNAYFPMDALKDEFFAKNAEVTTHCPWKGDASYFDVTVDGKTADYAAWYYPDPKEAANNLKDRVAFWRGVTVEK
jgi:uncharacterized protein (DUF427 family)